MYISALVRSRGGRPVVSWAGVAKLTLVLGALWGLSETALAAAWPAGTGAWPRLGMLVATGLFVAAQLGAAAADFWLARWPREPAAAGVPGGMAPPLSPLVRRRGGVPAISWAGLLRMALSVVLIWGAWEFARGRAADRVPRVGSRPWMSICVMGLVAICLAEAWVDSRGGARAPVSGCE